MMEDMLFTREAEAATTFWSPREEPRTSQGASPAPWVGHCADAILLGMPQLCLLGLSEAWLLKELGHRHWMMLARCAGQTAPNFTDERGDPVYAAFCALAIRDGDFRTARENDLLAISSSIRRLSRTQMLSRHWLNIGGRPLGEVDMVSTFVRRERGGSNHAVARFEAPGLPKISPMEGDDHLAARAAKFRSGRIREHMGFTIDERTPLARYCFDPCPGQDFNGAGFLYFSSFLAFVDRAEWAFSRADALQATTRHREIFFTGNLDPGETLDIGLVEKRQSDNSLAHHCEIRRDGDKVLIARVFSCRALD